MNVLYCVPLGIRGGVERFLEDVIVRHDPQRVKPTVLSFSTGPWLKDLETRGITTYGLDGVRLRRPWQTFREIDTILKKERIDLVHSSYSWCHALSAPAAAWNGCKKVWFHHGPVADHRWHGFMPLVPADLVFVNSNFLRERLIRTYYWAPKTVVLHYGIDAGQFEPDQDKRRAFREQWRLSENHLAVGLVAFIDEWKGQDVFLEAALRIRDRAPDVRMFVVGGPRFGRTQGAGLELEAKLRRFVDEQGLRDRVVFTGHLDLREGALDGLDVVVHASTQPEPFGVVLLEAMAKGKAIIASGEGGPVEILTDGVDGMLVPPRQPELLAERIEAFANDRTLRETLGGNAHRSVLERFSADAATRRLESYYDEIVS